jgi:hypothetical protein
MVEVLVPAQRLGGPPTACYYFRKGGLNVTNGQYYLAIGLPSILVILSWLSNRSETAALCTEINGLRSEVRGEVAQLRSEMHKDMMQLLTSMVSLHERVAVVESRQQ